MDVYEQKIRPKPIICVHVLFFVGAFQLSKSAGLLLQWLVFSRTSENFNFIPTQENFNFTKYL